MARSIGESVPQAKTPVSKTSESDKKQSTQFDSKQFAKQFAKRQSGQVFNQSNTANTIGTLQKEFLFAFFTAIVIVMVDKDYTRCFFRLTGICGIFFILALGADSKNYGKVCIAFGLLVDIVLLLQAVTNTVSSITNESDVTGAGSTTTPVST